MDEQYGKLIEPAPVPFSFGAPGWYVLAALLLLLLVLLVSWAWRYYQKNKYRKYALNWLNEKEQQWLQSGDYETLVYETGMLLKRVAMRKYGRENIAGKRGAAFTTYINSTWRARAFTEADEYLLSQEIYHSEAIEAEKAMSFVGKVKQWIKQHGRVRS